jgi:integrase
VATAVITLSAEAVPEPDQWAAPAPSGGGRCPEHGGLEARQDRVQQLRRRASWRNDTSGGGCPTRRAAELFTAATGGATLHQLRHSALTHAAEDGANTSTLLSFSGHTSVTSLARYARVSPEALRRWQQHRDPATRRR